jgi:hypothetical protein
VFVIGEQVGEERPFRFYYLLVDHCGAGTVESRGSPATGWWILDTTAHHPLASRIRYGVIPTGYVGADSSPIWNRGVTWPISQGPAASPSR